MDGVFGDISPIKIIKSNAMPPWQAVFYDPSAFAIKPELMVPRPGSY